MAPPTGTWNGASSRAAPWYGIPSHSLVSVEHPFVVKDVDKAVAMVNAGDQVSKVSMSKIEIILSRVRYISRQDGR